MGGGTPAHINDTQKWVTWASKQPHSNHPVHPSNHPVVGTVATTLKSHLWLIQ